MFMARPRNSSNARLLLKLLCDKPEGYLKLLIFSQVRHRILSSLKIGKKREDLIYTDFKNALDKGERFDFNDLKILQGIFTTPGKSIPPKEQLQYPKYASFQDFAERCHRKVMLFDEGSDFFKGPEVPEQESSTQAEELPKFDISNIKKRTFKIWRYLEFDITVYPHNKEPITATGLKEWVDSDKRIKCFPSHIIGCDTVRFESFFNAFSESRTFEAVTNIHERLNTYLDTHPFRPLITVNISRFSGLAFNAQEPIHLAKNPSQVSQNLIRRFWIIQNAPELFLENEVIPKADEKNIQLNVIDDTSDFYDFDITGSMDDPKKELNEIILSSFFAMNSNLQLKKNSMYDNIISDIPHGVLNMVVTYYDDHLTYKISKGSTENLLILNSIPDDILPGYISNFDPAFNSIVAGPFEKDFILFYETTRKWKVQNNLLEKDKADYWCKLSFTLKSMEHLNNALDIKFRLKTLLAEAKEEGQ
jgi:hypothetical protein